MWAKSRTTGGQDVGQNEAKKGGNLLEKLSSIVIVSLFFVAAAVGTAYSALPAPSWMPGSPIMAGSQVILLWMPVPNAVKYNIYLNGKKIGEAMAVQHIIPAPEASGEYAVEIAPVDASGAEGAKSRPGTFKIISIEPPGDIYVRAAEKAIQLRWDTSKGAVIYNVYRAEKEGADAKLVTSVQGDSYSDTAVQPGKLYFYYVTAKDLSGKESAKSKVARGQVVKAAEVVQAVKVEIKVVPTKPAGEGALFGKNKIEMFGDMKLAPNGFLYLVDSGQGHILKINADTLDVDRKFGGKGTEPGQFGRPFMLAISPEGNLYVTDVDQKKVKVFDADGTFQFDFAIPETKDKTIIDGVLPHLRASGPGIAGIAIDNKENVVYVADARFNTIYRFDKTGKFLGYLGHGGDPGKDLSGPGEILVGDGGELFVSEPTSHLILVIDSKTAEFKRKIGLKSKGFIGGFIGVSGMCFDGAGNIVVADSGVHSIQVFDAKTGDYKYHIGDESGKVDPEMSERAYLGGVQLPVAVNVGKNKRIFFVRGDKKQVLAWDIVAK